MKKTKKFYFYYKSHEIVLSNLNKENKRGLTIYKQPFVPSKTTKKTIVFDGGMKDNFGILDSCVKKAQASIDEMIEKNKVCELCKHREDASRETKGGCVCYCHEPYVK